MKETLETLKKTQTEILYNLKLISAICGAEKNNKNLVKQLHLMEEQLINDLEEVRNNIKQQKM